MGDLQKLLADPEFTNLKDPALRRKLVEQVDPDIRGLDDAHYQALLTQATAPPATAPPGPIPGMEKLGGGAPPGPPKPRKISEGQTSRAAGAFYDVAGAPLADMTKALGALMSPNPLAFAAASMPMAEAAYNEPGRIAGQAKAVWRGPTAAELAAPGHRRTPGQIRASHLVQMAPFAGALVPQLEEDIDRGNYPELGGHLAGVSLPFWAPKVLDAIPGKKIVNATERGAKATARNVKATGAGIKAGVEATPGAVAEAMNTALLGEIAGGHKGAAVAAGLRVVPKVLGAAAKGFRESKAKSGPRLPPPPGFDIALGDTLAPAARFSPDEPLPNMSSPEPGGVIPGTRFPEPERPQMPAGFGVGEGTTAGPIPNPAADLITDYARQLERQGYLPSEAARIAEDIVTTDRARAARRTAQPPVSGALPGTRFPEPEPPAPLPFGFGTGEGTTAGPIPAAGPRSPGVVPPADGALPGTQFPEPAKVPGFDIGQGTTAGPTPSYKAELIRSLIEEQGYSPQDAAKLANDLLKFRSEGAAQPPVAGTMPGTQFPNSRVPGFGVGEGTTAGPIPASTPRPPAVIPPPGGALPGTGFPPPPAGFNVGEGTTAGPIPGGPTAAPGYIPPPGGALPGTVFPAEAKLAEVKAKIAAGETPTAADVAVLKEAAAATTAQRAATETAPVAEPVAAAAPAAAPPAAPLTGPAATIAQDLVERGVPPEQAAQKAQEIVATRMEGTAPAAAPAAPVEIPAEPVVQPTAPPPGLGPAPGGIPPAPASAELGPLDTGLQVGEGAGGRVFSQPKQSHGDVTAQINISARDGEYPGSPAGQRTKGMVGGWAKDVYGRGWESLTLEEKLAMNEYVKSNPGIAPTREGMGLPPLETPPAAAPAAAAKPKATPKPDKNALSNQYRQEAKAQWDLYGPYRESLYVKARLKGKTPEQAIEIARSTPEPKAPPAENLKNPPAAAPAADAIAPEVMERLTADEAEIRAKQEAAAQPELDVADKLNIAANTHYGSDFDKLSTKNQGKLVNFMVQHGEPPTLADAQAGRFIKGPQAAAKPKPAPRAPLAPTLKNAPVVESEPTPAAAPAPATTAAAPAAAAATEEVFPRDVASKTHYGVENFVDLDKTYQKALKDYEKKNGTFPTKEDAEAGRFTQGRIQKLEAAEPLPHEGGDIGEKLDKIAEDANERMRKSGAFKGTSLQANFPAQHLPDMAIWGAAKLAKGTVSFAKWSKEMLADAGGAAETLKPKLREVYEQSQKNLERHIRSTVGELPNTNKLLRMYNQGIEGKDWYKHTMKEITKVFGPIDGPLFVDFLAATSPNSTVAANTALALKAYTQYKTGQPFTGYLGQVIESLNKVVAGEEFGSNKVKSFKANLFGDPTPVTVDRWIARAFGFKGITEGQYKFMDYALTQIARERGIEPRQLQASIWKTIKEAEGAAGNTSDAFEKVLYRKIAKDPKLAGAIAEALEKGKKK